MERMGRRIRYKWLTVAVICLAGGFISASVYRQQRASELALARAEWQKEAYEQSVRTGLLFTRAVQITRSFAALFTVSDEVTAAEFARYASYMVHGEPEIAAVFWAPYVQPHQRAIVTTQLQQTLGTARGIFDYSEPGHIAVTAPERDFYLPIRYLAPETKANTVLGLDIHGRPLNEARRRQAMQDNQPFTTPVFADVASPSGAASVAIYYPVRRPERQPPLHQPPFLGFIVLLMSPEVLMRHEFGLPEQSRFLMQLIDYDDQQRVIAVNRSATDATAPVIQFDYPLAMPGRHWVLRLYGHDPLLRNHTAEWLLLCLLTVTLLLAVISERLMSRYLRLKRRNLALEQQRQDLRQQANTDSLTGLHNRRYFQQKVEALLAQPERSFELAICLLDLDNFKQVNDSLSHSHGDQLLQRVAQALLAETRLGDLVARLGGDEFILAFPLQSGLAELPPLLERLQKRITRLGHEVTAGRVVVSASFGVSTSSGGCNSYATLFQRADLAMYAAKHSGKHTYRFYSGALTPADGE